MKVVLVDWHGFQYPFRRLRRTWVCRTSGFSRCSYCCFPIVVFLLEFARAKLRDPEFVLAFPMAWATLGSLGVNLSCLPVLSAHADPVVASCILIAWAIPTFLTYHVLSAVTVYHFDHHQEGRQLVREEPLLQAMHRVLLLPSCHPYLRHRIELVFVLAVPFVASLVLSARTDRCRLFLVVMEAEVEVVVLVVRVVLEVLSAVLLDGWA